MVLYDVAEVVVVAVVGAGESVVLDVEVVSVARIVVVAAVAGCVAAVVAGVVVDVGSVGSLLLGPMCPFCRRENPESQRHYVAAP